MLQHRRARAVVCCLAGIALSAGVWTVVAFGMPLDRGWIVGTGALALGLLGLGLGWMSEATLAPPQPGEKAPPVPPDEEDWHQALDALGEGVWEWFPATGRMQFSRGWKEMLSCSDEEIANTVEAWAERIHPEDWVRTLNDMESHLAGATEIYVNEHRARCSDGSYKWVLDRGVVLTRDQDGSPTHLIGIRTDISIRKEMEDQLWRQAVELSNANEQLAEMSITDALTGLRNRRGFMRRSEEEIASCVGAGRRFSVVFMDIDFFKRINDTYGHESGDAVLCELGRRLSAHVDSPDQVGRIGGEEFAVLLPGQSCTEATEVAARLRASIADAPVIIPDGRELAVTASFGVTCSDGGDTLSAVLSRADMALYDAKGAGRNRVRAVCTEHGKSSAVVAAD